MNEIEEFYGKFNEDKRLLRRYGQIEYLTTMKYIHEVTDGRTGLRILDVGAATGRYAVPLAQEGQLVTAVDLVNYHVGILKQKIEKQGITGLEAKKGNALKLSKFPADAYDIVLLFGPLYHLFTTEDKVKALTEAKRVLKTGGTIMVSYLMNEFGVIRYGFLEGHALESADAGKLDGDFHIQNDVSDLFSFVRLEDIDALNRSAGLFRKKIVAQDGASNYMRNLLSEMSEEMFEKFYAYHLSTCERPELLGASCHTLDMVGK